MTHQQNFQPEISNDSVRLLKETLQASIVSHGNFQFSEDRWYYAKRHTSSRAKEQYIVNFRKIPVAYRNTVKYYALSLTISPNKIQEKIYKIADFLLLLTNNFQEMPLKKVTYKHVQAYEQWLQSGDCTSSTNYMAYH